MYCVNCNIDIVQILELEQNKLDIHTTIPDFSTKFKVAHEWDVEEKKIILDNQSKV